MLYLWSLAGGVVFFGEVGNFRRWNSTDGNMYQGGMCSQIISG